MSWKHSAVITGGTVNLGYHAALEIAKAHPECLVVISSRSDKEGAAAAINSSLGQDNVKFLAVDLSSTASVRNYAKIWSAEGWPSIKYLVLNAGLQFPGALTKTAEGLESTFAVNHLGHALLFHLLWPHIAADARITVTSSGTHDPDQKSGLPDAIYNTAEDLAHPPPAMVKVAGRQRYASSKLANVLWTYALNRRLLLQRPRRNIVVNAFDPGLMPGTGLAREASGFEKFLWLRVLPHVLPLLRLAISPNIHSPKESGIALARLATGKDIGGDTGKYFEGRKVIQSSKASYAETSQEDLWNWTVRYVAESTEEATRFDELK